MTERSPRRKTIAFVRDGIVGSAFALGGGALLFAAVAHLAAPMPAPVPGVAFEPTTIATPASAAIAPMRVRAAAPRRAPPPANVRRSTPPAKPVPTRVAGRPSLAPRDPAGVSSRPRIALAPLVPAPRVSAPNVRATQARAPLARAPHDRAPQARASRVPTRPRHDRARPRPEAMPEPPLGFDARPALTEAATTATAAVDLAGIRVRGRSLPVVDDRFAPGP